MESSSCLCINNILKALEQMVISLLSTTGHVRYNNNTPATDSGYVTSTQENLINNNTNNTNENLTLGFYSTMIAAALILIMLGLKNKTLQSKSKLIK